MLKRYFIFSLLILLPSCVSPTAHERHQLAQLEARNITLQNPPTDWQAPAHPGAAAAMQLLPGGGNFYLATGNAAEPNQYLFGFLNLISWPFSILWGIPEVIIDAQTINKRELLIWQETLHLINHTPAAVDQNHN